MATPDLIGKTLKGRYRLKRLIGEGGMGSVYEGTHVEVGRKIAIKLVHAAHTKNPEVAARLKQEARATGVIESENVVQVLDAGEDEELGLFIVMELLRGENLEAVIRRDKRLEPVAAAMIATQAARGLMRAHAEKIVHRDLKPANVVLCEREDKTPLVKLVDFGIAKIVHDATEAEERSSAALTRIGGVVGTPQYMAPEQAQALAIDGRTDIYALGALLYEMLTGRPPVAESLSYEMKVVQICTQLAPRVRATIPTIDPRLDQLVADMMAGRVEERPQSMEKVIERLGEIFSTEEIAPSSFSGVGLAPVLSRTGAHAASSGKFPTPVAPASTSDASTSAPTLVGGVAAAPAGIDPAPESKRGSTDVGVAVDRPSSRLMDDLGPPDAAAGSGNKVFLIAGAVVAVIIAIFAIKGAASEPETKSGLVQASASVATKTEPPHAPSADPVVSASGSGAVPAPAASSAPRPPPAPLVAPASPLPVVAAPQPAPAPDPAPAPAPAPVVTEEVAPPAPAPAADVDAGTRDFGAAGLSQEF